MIVKGAYHKGPQKDDGPRVNNQIRAREVRLIGPEGEQLGVFVISEAIRRAEEAGFDLVEVAPTGEPPVCRIMDYGKYKYQKQKRDHEAKKKQTFIHLKEVKLRPKIKIHDLEIKVKHILRFLDDGNKAKVTLVFRWREMSHPEAGTEVMNHVKEMIGDLGIIESEPKMESRAMIMIVAPSHKKEKEKEKENRKKPEGESTSQPDSASNAEEKSGSETQDIS